MPTIYQAAEEAHVATQANKIRIRDKTIMKIKAANLTNNTTIPIAETAYITTATLTTHIITATTEETTITTTTTVTLLETEIIVDITIGVEMITQE